MQTASSSKRGVACSRTLAPFVMALGVLAALPCAAGAELMEETHEFYFDHADPNWNTTYTIPFDLPKFDTMGGAYELLGCTIDYFDPDLDYTWGRAENATADIVGCDLRWETSFAAYGPAGSPWFPLPPGPEYLTLGRGRGQFVGPFAPADGPYTEVREWDDANWSQITDDPAFLAEVTGTGSIPMTAELVMEDFIVQPVEGPFVPPDVVFDPNLLWMTPNRISAGIWVTYHYTPEPSTLGLMGLGALALLRRRR